MDTKDMIKIGVAGVVLVTAVVLIVSSMGGDSGPPRHDRAYYFDLSSGELFADEADLPLPIRDGDGVLAFVYACGDCTGDKQVGYVQTLNDEARRAQQQMRTQPSMELHEKVQQGTLVAPPPEQPGATPQWTSIQSPAGQQLTSFTQTCPDGKPPRICRPQQ